MALLLAFVMVPAGAADDSPVPSPAEVTALVQNYLSDAARLREAQLTPEERTSLTQRVAEERAALKNARKSMRIKAGAKPFGTTSNSASASPSVSRCETCREVWKSINLQLGKWKYPTSVFAAFEATCMGSEKVRYDENACEDMYDDIYAMTDDYLNNEQAACDKMCVGIAPPPVKPPAH